MKLEELELGEFYTCSLSGLKVLVFEAPEQTSEDENGNIKVVKDAFKAGKIYYITDSGLPEFKYIDIHDGQLEKL